MLTELLEADGFHLALKTATELSSPCPWCGGTDRFQIFLGEGKYWCRQCGAHGDALQYLRDFRKLTFPEAAAMVGKSISTLTGKSRSSAASTPAPRPIEPPKVQPPLWRARAAKGIERAHNNLMKNPEALAWLRQVRGITSETCARFRLGWLEQDLFFKKEEFGLPLDGKKLVIPAGLLIPWQDKRIRVRRSNDEEVQQYGRYYLVPGSGTEPMTIGTPSETTAVIVESELDAILFAQEIKRKTFIVAMGSAQVKARFELLSQFNRCPVVLVALDNDVAGAKAAQWWPENVPGCHRTLTPSQFGKDFGEAFKNGLDLNLWLNAAMTIVAQTLTTK
jgi:DNA primase